MTDLSQNGYTHNQVLRLLEAHDSVEYQRVVVYIIRSRNFYKQLMCSKISIQCDAEDAVKYGATFEFLYDPDLNRVSDKLQPYFIYERSGLSFSWPLSPPLRIGAVEETRDIGISTVRAEAYDEAIVLRNNSIESSDKAYFPKGTPYVSAIDSLLGLANFTSYIITPSDKILQTDRTFDEGERILSVVNELLEEINYVSFEPDKQSGVLTSKPYQRPSTLAPQIHYGGGHKSLIKGSVVYTYDSLDKPNNFIAYASNPDLPDGGFRSTFTNTSPSSDLSVDNQGYIITARPTQYTSVADQETLDELLLKEVEETTAMYKPAKFETMVMPHHEVRDIISFDNELISGIYEELSWKIDVDVDEITMTHTVRGLYSD